jgi:hypothetical protein
MKWIALAILVIVVPYTVLTLRYRKPGPAYRPYEDMKKRANVIRLLSAGYQRVTLLAERPADIARIAPRVAASNAPAGIPAELRSTLVEVPLLPAEIGNIYAATSANTTQPYAIQFTCTLPDDKQQLSGAELFIKGQEALIMPTFERLNGQLLTRTRDNVIVLTVPAGVLKPGQYHVTLAGQRTSRAWSLEVK